MRMQKCIDLTKRHPYLLLLGLFICSRIIIVTGVLASHQRNVVSLFRYVFCWLFNFPLADSDTHALFVNPSEHNLLDVATYWDGHWYLDIIAHGYRFDGSTLHQNIAHYPFFPWACQWFFPILELVGVSSGTAIVLTGVFISNILFLASLWLFYRLGKKCAPKLALSAACLLALYPGNLSSAMFLSESTYLALSLLFFVMIESNRTWFGALAGGAAALTRVNGILLPVFYLQKIGFRTMLKPRSCLPFALLFLSLLIYPAFLYAHFGDPWIYFKLHGGFRPQTPLKKILLALLCFGSCWAWARTWFHHSALAVRLGWLTSILKKGILITVGLYLIYSMLVLQGTIPRLLPGSFAALPQEQFLLIAMLIVLALAGRYYYHLPKEYRLYTLLSIYPILASGTFLSVDRYLLAVFPLFWALAAATQKSRIAQASLFIIFPILLFGKAVLYSATGWLFLF